MTLMKLFSVLLVLLFSANLLGQSSCPKMVEIKAARLSLETFSNIDCSSFEKSLGSRIKSRELCSADTLNKFYKLIKTTKKSRKNLDIDVRIKILLHQDNEPATTIFCMDKFENIIVDNYLLRKNKELARLIKSCLPEGIL